MQSESQRDSDYRSDQYTKSTYYPEHDACIRVIGFDKVNCLAKAHEAYRINEREERDLVAQETTAAWTFVMSGAAIFGVILSIGGVILVWVTFRETRKTNEIAREVGHAQVRAYLKIEVKAQKLEAGKPAIIDIKVFNTGQTPALNLALSSHLIMKQVGFDWGKRDKIFPYGETPTQVLHAMGDCSTQAHMIPPRALAQHEVDEIRAGRIVLFGRVFGVYEDVFKQQREVVMYFEFSGEYCFSSGFAMMSPNGNYDGERRQ